tara:strand:- start:37214 stop:37612 length:399 start_codon:yes stop_codon:yes gene_type:complete
MGYSISLRLDIKKVSNHNELEMLIYDIGNNLNATNLYSDFELTGIDNYIKNNFKIIIIELDNKNDLIFLIKLIKNLNKIEIEYIYDENEIIYCDKIYLSNLDLNQNKDLIIKKIDYNLNKCKYKDISNLIKN